MSEAANEWGRVAPDGTVYVRTAGGERAVGSWLAGGAEAGLAYYARRYAELAGQVDLLEQRAASGAADPAAVASAGRKLRESLESAQVVGDLDALARRLEAVVDAAGSRAEDRRAERAAAAARAVEAKRALAEEAEQLAASTDWKAAGDRFRELVEQWRTIRIDRRTDSELWQRLSAARSEFTRRRGAHFSSLDEQRRSSQTRKQQLVEQAEALAESTDWAATAARYRELMAEWKAAGRAARGVDDELWARFRTAQDTFFSRRGEVFAERDAEQRTNLERKQALLAEAEALDLGDLDRSRRRLRELQEAWDAVGRVPRDAMAGLDRRMAAAADRLRASTDARWRHADPAGSPFVVRLRESVAKLESRLERARASGDAAAASAAEEALATQREWLAQAERAGR